MIELKTAYIVLNASMTKEKVRIEANTLSALHLLFLYNWDKTELLI